MNISTIPKNCKNVMLFLFSFLDPSMNVILVGVLCLSFLFAVIWLIELA